MNKVYGQHGDVIFHEVKEVPERAKKVEIFSGFVVERGEGVHTHCLVTDDVSKVSAYELDGVLYLHVKEDVQIDHEEYKLRTLKPGIYKKVIEREFDYEDMESRNTRD